MVERPGWATDVNLYSRLKDAVMRLAVARLDYQRRTSDLAEELLKINELAFPDELVGQWRKVREIISSSVHHYPHGTRIEMGGLTPTDRREFATSLFSLLEAMIEDRGVLKSRGKWLADVG